MPQKNRKSAGHETSDVWFESISCEDQKSALKERKSIRELNTEWGALWNVALFITILIALLIWLHAPGLGLSWPPGGIDRSADFWGGLLVETIGISLEIALIVAILDFFKDRRWSGSRSKIAQAVFSDLFQRTTRYNMLLMTGDDNNNERTDVHSKPDNSLFDMLQFMTSAMTPEIAKAVLDYKLSVSKMDSGISGYIYLRREGKKAFPVRCRTMAFDGLDECEAALDKLQPLAGDVAPSYKSSLELVRAGLRNLSATLEADDPMR